MNLTERETLVNRIMTGIYVFKNEERTFLIYPSTFVDKALAEEVYISTLHNNRFAQLQTQETIEQVLIDNGLWSIVMAGQLERLPDEIESLKVELYQSYFKSKKLDRARRQLRKAKKKFEEFTVIRHSLDDTTIEGVAKLARNNFLMSRCLRDIEGNPIASNGTSGLVGQASNFLSSQMITEAQAREIARTDPWKSVWVTGKAEGSVFGQPASLLTEEQRGLILWSRMYDSVYESMECPPEAIIKDDDVLDGWLIDQNRKRDSEQAKKYGESHLGNVKGNEVFIPVDSIDDARKVDALNTIEARRIKQQRLMALQGTDKLAEQDLPDAKQRMRQQAREQLQGTIQKGKR